MRPNNKIHSLIQQRRMNNIHVPMATQGQFNINSLSAHPHGRLLSNLTNRPFEIGLFDAALSNNQYGRENQQQMCASVEGFFAGILYPFDDSRRKRAFASCYGYAQKMVKDAGKSGMWWDNKRFEYGSKEHKDLVKRALLECTLQNPDRREALIATKGLILVHLTGTQEDPITFFTRKEFCEAMTEIRERLIACNSQN